MTTCDVNPASRGRRSTKQTSRTSGLKFIEADGYLRVCVSFRSSEGHSAHDLLGDVILRCAERKQKRLLIELALRKDEIAADFAPALRALIGMSGGMKIALVQPHTSEEIRAFEGEVLSRVGAEYRQFTDVEEAAAWLASGPLQDWIPARQRV